MSNSIAQFLELVWTRAKFGFISEASSNKFGYLWWILEPVFQIVAYYFVFGILLIEFRHTGSGAAGSHYAAFLLCGVLPWICFSKSVSHSVGVILNGGWLIKHIEITKLFFPISVFIQNFIKSAVVFGLMLVALIVIGQRPSSEWLLIPVVFCLQGLMTLSVCILVSAVTPFLPDLRYIVPIILQITMFSSGVFYDVSIIDPELRKLFFLNPMAVLLDTYRSILLDNSFTSEEMFRLVNLLLSSIVLLIASAGIVLKSDKLYPSILK